MTEQTAPQQTLFGHPTGLFTLFFAEMWERFSYYGMRALLVFYMIKGFLGYGDSDAYAVYGAYTALVYMTPFFGGMLADRVLGARRAVVLGGLLMAAGHLMMTVENDWAFFFALALLIAGNGFFKPNISSMVGSLYPQGSIKRDGGFTIFYIGINLGAAMSPLLCGYIGETYGWHYGFGLATVGMLTGLAVFVMPTRVTQIAILAGAVAAAGGLIWYRPDNVYSIAGNAFIALALLVAGLCAWRALAKGGLPDHVGQPPDRGRLKEKVLGGLMSRELAIYVGTILLLPVVTLFVCGFALARGDKTAWTLISAETVESWSSALGPMKEVALVVLKEISKPAGLVLMLSGLGAAVYLGMESFRLEKVRRERMFVVLILTFFSMLFWSFFEQAGSSVNNFTDRNVDRVFAENTITADQVGTTIQLTPTQAQLGFHNGEQLFTLDLLTQLREEHQGDPEYQIDWQVEEDNVGMGTAGSTGEIPASTFQAINPTFIMIFGLVFTALWAFLARRRWEPSTPLKFAMGLLQLGMGFGCFWMGVKGADERGMVSLSWLLLGYLLQTTGELCLSPVGLSMITKLSPARLVSTVMGTWFLATAFSQYLAAIISQFTGIEEGGGGDGAIPAPSETVHVYGDVFGKIALAAMCSAAVCFLLVPLLKKWMHEGVEVPED